jgi:hypothetical protein
MLVSMIVSGSSYAEIALAMDKGLGGKDINNRCLQHLKESSGIIKLPGKAGRHSGIAWTAEGDATIVSMNAGGSFYAGIASAYGKGLKKIDISKAGGNITWH